MPEEVEVKHHIPINPSNVCYRAFELMQSKQYDDAEKLLNNTMAKIDDDVAVGLFHSALGVLYKLKGESKTAWKHYQRAEKLIPDDPALKIIVARLLIEHFAEYDVAIKRAKKVLKLIPDNSVFTHQSYITMGLAYFGKGQKNKAAKMLVESMKDDFKGFVTAHNIDFHLVEVLLRSGFAVPECRTFLEKALDFARLQNEDVWVNLIEKMLKSFPVKD